MGKISTFCKGFLCGAACTGVALAAAKTAKEIKADMTEITFRSSDFKNSAKIRYGSSEFAKGLTVFKVVAESVVSEDDCKLVFVAKSKEIYAEWKDDDHLEILVGKGRNKQCCDINFEGKEITILYALRKITTPSTLNKISG